MSYVRHASPDLRHFLHCTCKPISTPPQHRPPPNPQPSHLPAPPRPTRHKKGGGGVAFGRWTMIGRTPTLPSHSKIPSSHSFLRLRRQLGLTLPSNQSSHFILPPLQPTPSLYSHSPHRDIRLQVRKTNEMQLEKLKLELSKVCVCSCAHA
jgi:hypothetical protein